MKIIGDAHEMLGASVSKEAVYCRVESPSCVDMQVVDLPGFREFAMDDSQKALQQSMRAFVRSMVQGVNLEMVLDDGTALQTQCFLDKELQKLLLHVGQDQHMILIHHIERVVAPEEAQSSGIGSLRRTVVDEASATLVMSGSLFVTLRLDNALAREYFEVCMRVLLAMRDSRRDGAQPEGLIQ